MVSCAPSRLTARYPVYIISKGRADSRLTAKALDKIGQPFRIVVEPQEAEQYGAVIGYERVLVLPFLNLGQGSIPARNWVWDHALGEGHKRHWILDDNIGWFSVVRKLKRVVAADARQFALAEEWAGRYMNVPMAAMQYEGMPGTLSNPTVGTLPPVILNHRCYSCILLDNSVPFRWRGRYNEDTDLSLRLLKAGYCTATFMAFMCHKVGTMTLKGGNTDHLYRQDADFDGRFEMAKSLVLQHPDVTRIRRWKGRWQHWVDYRPFRGNRLIPTPEWQAELDRMEGAAHA